MVATICHLVRMTEVIRYCLYFKSCGKKEVYNGIKWKEHWYNHKTKTGKICYNHYQYLYSHPKVTASGFWKRYNKKRRYGKKRDDYDKRIMFLGIFIYLSWNIRKGYCSYCSNNIFDKSCIRTNIHHLFYVRIMPWACTVELCPKCHINETVNDHGGSIHG